ncbi:unnamed protein product, partial [Phaeothamnion confervicola]
GQILALCKDPDPEVRYEALHWAGESTRSQESPPAGYARQVFAVLHSELADTNPKVRKMAYEGLLLNANVDPTATLAVMKRDLADPDREIRFEILGAIAGDKGPWDDPKLLAGTMAAPLEKRLEAAVEVRESFAVVEALAHIGPLPESALHFLLAHFQEIGDSGQILNAVSQQGPRALPLIARIL